MNKIIRHGIPEGNALPIAKAVAADGWLYVSGQVPRDRYGDVVGGSMVQQARLAMDNMMTVLTDAGYSVRDIVRVGVWIDDPRDFAEFNKVFREYFEPEHAPARVTVQAALMCDCKVEVDCIAYKSND